METPSKMSEADRARDKVQEDRLARLQTTLRKPDVQLPDHTDDWSETVPGVRKEAVEFWDNVPL